MRADSINSLGILFMYWRIMKMLTAEAMNGMMSDRYELVHLSWLIKMNKGTRINWNGIIVEPSMTKNSAFLPRKRYLAKPKPARDEVNRTARVLMIATAMLLPYHAENGQSLNSRA